MFEKSPVHYTLRAISGMATSTDSSRVRCLQYFRTAQTEKPLKVMNRRKFVGYTLVVLSFGSQFFLLWHAYVHSSTYKAISFGSIEFSDMHPVGPTAYTYFPLEAFPDVEEDLDPEPVLMINSTGNDTFAYSLFFFQGVEVHDGGEATREDVQALEEMQGAAQVQAWSSGLIDLFVDVTKAKKEMEELIDFMAFHSGIQSLLEILESIGQVYRL
ncbi:MAG: hypothetical protein ACE5IO_05200 [Thermoplasmata archaeon]